MSTSVSKVLAWKERQQLIPISIGLLTTLVVAMLVALVSQTNANQTTITGQFFGFAMMFGTLAGLAMGTFAFAPEKESGTADLLRSYPVSGDTIASVKFWEATRFFAITWILAGVVAALVLLITYGEIVGFAESGWNNEGMSRQLATISVSMIVPVETFLISLITSAICKKSINAVVSAAILALVGVFTASYWFGVLGIKVVDSRLPFYMLSGHVVFLLILAYGVYQTSRSWLVRQTDSSAAPLTSLLPFADRRAVHASVAGNQPKRMKAHRPLRTLLWQVARSRTPAVVFCLAALALWQVGWLATAGHHFLDINDLRAWDVTFNFHCGITSFVALVVGLTTFTGDQTNHQYRFFQQRADFASKIWLSRQIPTLVVCLAVALCSFVMLSMIYGTQFIIKNFQTSTYNYYGYAGANSYLHRFHTGDFLFVFLGVASVAQLISIFCRSAIILFLIGVLGGPLLGWYFSYLAWLDEPLWIFGWPLVIFCFALSWIYSGSWIREHKRWSNIATLSSLTLVVFGFSSAALFWHRYHQIPKFENESVVRLQALMDNQTEAWKTDPGFYAAPLELKSAFEKVVAVEEAAHEFDPEKYPEDFKAKNQIDDELRKIYVDRNQAAIEQIIVALRDDRSRYYSNLVIRRETGTEYTRIRSLLIQQFEVKLSEGKLDKALDAALALLDANNLNFQKRPLSTYWCELLIRWCEADGQTSERIFAARQRMKDRLDAFLDAESPKAAEAMHVIGLQYVDQWKYDKSSKNPFSIYGFFPNWEVERTSRLWQHQTDLLYTKSWRQICNIHSPSNSGSVDVLNRYHNFYSPPRDSNIGKILAQRDHTMVKLTDHDPLTPNDVAQFFNSVRYTETRIALAAYWCDNETYPESLTMLVPNYLDTLPKTSGQNFAYSAEGLDLPVTFRPAAYYIPGYNDAISLQRENWKISDFIDAGQPFLLPWSGIADMKREFIVQSDQEVVDPATGDTTIEYSESKIGYWIPRSKNYQGISSDRFLLKVATPQESAAPESR